MPFCIHFVQSFFHCFPLCWKWATVSSSIFEQACKFVKFLQSFENGHFVFGTFYRSGRSACSLWLVEMGHMLEHLPFVRKWVLVNNAWLIPQI
jgi:hypothetical protein